MPAPTISLIISFVLFAGFILFLTVHEYRSRHKEQVAHKECDEVLLPAAKKADDLHRKKFGRASSEIGERFPELKAIK